MLMKKTLIAMTFLVLLFSSVLCVRHSRLEKRDSEARKALMEVYELETAYKAMFGHYTDNIYAIAFIQDTLVTDGGKANYLISLDETTDSTFKATAVSVIDFDGDGQFSQWQVDEAGNIIEIVED
jgi:type IV pilus assembly protein PilE